ncbi:Uncharacterised protein [Mycobacteroides abscessus subsp. abscessus]|nr:Uncharacterised protein [Mycobacteroides abscessus subsp. abscessus]
MDELSGGPGAGGVEERVEIELVELPLAGDRDQFFGHLISHQAHLG